jgi:hypothetical protein
MKTRREARGQRREVALRKTQNSMPWATVQPTISNVLFHLGCGFALSPLASRLLPRAAP